MNLTPPVLAIVAAIHLVHAEPPFGFAWWVVGTWGIVKTLYDDWQRRRLEDARLAVEGAEAGLRAAEYRART